MSVNGVKLLYLSTVCLILLFVLREGGLKGGREEGGGGREEGRKMRKIGRTDGRKEREQGRKESRKEGREEGREVGRKNHQGRASGWTKGARTNGGGQTDGWTEGRKDERMHGQTDELTNGREDERIDVSAAEGRANRQTNKRVAGGRTDGRCESCRRC